MTGETREGAKSITVRTYKYDGREHRRWRAELAEIVKSRIILNAKFEDEVNHPLLGTIARGTVSIEHYWLDRWYNIFSFQDETGKLESFYCNVNVPPVFHRNVLSYIDLDMDVWVAPDLSFTVLDEDEFVANAERCRYPPEVRSRARQALGELINLIQGRQFPFNNLM